MNKILALALMLMLSIVTCTVAMAEAPTTVLSEEEAIEYLETVTGINVLFAYYSMEDTLVFIGTKVGILPHNEDFQYEAGDILRFLEAFIEGELKDLPEVTGCLNVLLTEDKYGIVDILRILDVKECLPLPIPGEPYYVPFMGLRFEVWPDADYEIMREEFTLQAYRIETSDEAFK